MKRPLPYWVRALFRIGYVLETVHTSASFLCYDCGNDGLCPPVFVTPFIRQKGAIVKRHLILSAALFSTAVLSSPALAQSHDDAHDDDAVATRLEDPALPDRIGAMTEVMMRSVLNMPIGPLAQMARQINPDSPIAHAPDDATVGEMTRTDDRDVERMASNARHAGNAATSMARQMRVMMPVLQAMVGDLAAQWRDAVPDRR